MQLHPDKSSPCCHTDWLLYSSFPLKHNTTIFYKLSSGNHSSTPLKLVFHKLCFIFMLTINVIMWRLFVFLWPFTLFRGIWPTQVCSVPSRNWNEEYEAATWGHQTPFHSVFLNDYPGWMFLLRSWISSQCPMSDTACSTVHCRARCMKVPRLQWAGARSERVLWRAWGVKCVRNVRQWDMTGV